MKTLRRILTGTALFVAACGFASADSITNFYNFPVSPLGSCSPSSGFAQNANGCSNLSGTPLSHTQAIAQFNNQGGTLTLNDVKISVVVLGEYDIALTNTGTGVQSYELENPGVEAKLCLLNTCSLASILTDDFVTAPGLTNCAVSGDPLACDDATFANMAVNQTIGPKFYWNTSSDSTTLISGLASFIGLGTTNIFEKASALTSVAGGSSLIAQNSAAAFALTITYDYSFQTGVPEPATYALLGSALLGLGLLRKRLTSK